MSARTEVARDYEWQERFRTHFAEIALGAIRVEVASWLDDAKRNTDMVIATLDNGHRLACRARRRTDVDGNDVRRLGLYLRQFTIRASRPSGATTELRKIREGWGDYMAYGFEAEPGADRLYPWLLLNLPMLREYLDGGGRWSSLVNADGTTFAVFDVFDMPLGSILNAEGHMMPTSCPRPCTACGRPAWTVDGTGCPLHPCCTSGVACTACRESDRLNNYRYGWPS